ncbi:hypothetical protein AWB75_06730 [Caballeronia catudaia]|uniref:DUF6566 domain-containing protein n=1 Tax=Caballeronia catudaia TaxID=1777136 RepID=A0A158DHA4_9BURK|nr:DUF6566 family protein [Caballeronia catudaia]SAK93853.1 hypothetical protein AWB75_06730 [Caballeronia catudaia]
MRVGMDAFMGFNFVVEVHQNERGAWFAKIEFSRDGRPLVDVFPRTTQPEWLTDEEAIRDGIEWARRTLMQQSGRPSHSWVASRARAYVWARSEVDRHPDGTTFHNGL